MTIEPIGINSTFELRRTDPAHIGNSPIEKVSKVCIDNKEAETSLTTTKSKGSFQSMVLDAMNQMNSNQIDVSNIQEKILTDPDSVDVHDVTTAMAKAQMSLNLAQTVIDRLISGWSELSQTR